MSPGSLMPHRKVCWHPMKQIIASGPNGGSGGSTWWWCPTCDLTWRDPDLRPSAAVTRGDQVPNRSGTVPEE